MKLKIQSLRMQKFQLLERINLTEEVVLQTSKTKGSSDLKQYLYLSCRLSAVANESQSLNLVH